MIAEIDRYHGIVFRQLLVGQLKPMTIAVANRSGRVDCFVVDGRPIQIKHSSKRLSPWQFTYPPEQLEELATLKQEFGRVWIMLVCGIDGVVALTLSELESIVQRGEGGAASVRVSRGRHAMYRVSGGRGGLPRPRARGVDAFLADL
jgi:hypothetical protein